MLAIAGTVGAASAALASGPVKTPDQKPVATSSNVVTTPAQKGPEFKVENLKGVILKGPEDNSNPPVLRGPGPANDFCANAEAVSVPGTAFGDTTGGIADPEATGLCITQGAASSGVWYTLVGNGNTLQVNTCVGAAFDTVLRVLTGSCEALTCVGGNDDFCGLSSQVEFSSTAGQTYYVYVSAFGAASAGTFQLDVIDLGAPPPAPPNDSCVDAIAINCGTVTVADNTGATVGPEDIYSCRVFGGPGFSSIWYKFTATETSARIQTCSSLAPADDSIIEVFAGGCGGLVSIGCNDDGCNGLLSRLDLQGLTVGQEYHIQLAGWAAADVGAYNLELVCPVPEAGPGDTCAAALPFGPIPGTIFGDTTGFEAEALACGVGDASPGVWYSIEGTGGVLRATTCNGTFYDSALSVMTGDCSFPTCVASNDDACGLQSTVTFPSTAGQTYYIVVRGFGTSAGAFQLDVEDLGPPGPGDNCGTAFALSVPGQAIGNTCAATPESLFCGVGDASPGIWYSVVGTGNQFIATTCNGTTYDSALSVLSGNCDFLTCVASNDDACGLQSTVVFPTVAGETYFIVIRGFSSGCGDYTLDVSELLPPPNDECVNAIALTCNTSVEANNLGATDNFAEDIYLCRVGGGNGFSSIWYNFVATEDSAVIQTCNSLFPADDSILQIFSSTAGCGTLVPLPDGCSDDGCNGLLSRAIVRNLTVGSTYYVMLSGWGVADAGAYTLELTCPAPPPAPGDDCPEAIDLGVAPAFVSGDTSTANPDSVDACGGPGAAAPGVWYRVTAPAAATRLRAETCGSAYDTVIRVYNGPCDFISCVGFNDDACGLQSSFIWDVTGGTEYYVYVGGFGSSSGTFTLNIDEPPPPCQVDPTGATPEGEADCGIPTDTVNGGCNSAVPVFGTIACNTPFFGSAAFDGFTRDTDWLQFVLTEPTEVTFTVQSEFASLIGFLETTTPNPTGDCSEFTGFVAPFAFPADDCVGLSVTAFLGAGTWTAFVAPQFTTPFGCGTGNNEYLALLEGCSNDENDCNENGIDDSVEIAGGARDCFDPTAMSVPGTTGGADTFLDECQCVGNWNRDATVNSGDISTFLTSWLNAVGGGPVSADINCDGVNNSGDISAFLTIWLAQVQGTVPTDGCP